jgi:hypothetical protein
MARATQGSLALSFERNRPLLACYLGRATESDRIGNYSAERSCTATARRRHRGVHAISMVLAPPLKAVLSSFRVYRRCGDASPKVGFAVDSTLEGAVHCELVSESEDPGVKFCLDFGVGFG